MQLASSLLSFDCLEKNQENIDDRDVNIKIFDDSPSERNFRLGKASMDRRMDRRLASVDRGVSEKRGTSSSRGNSISMDKMNRLLASVDRPQGGRSTDRGTFTNHRRLMLNVGNETFSKGDDTI